ncbi:MAG: helix-turn-helix domain-containing protein [Bacteroidales bacterium]|nr:helix-turn-helix domain-containing protein [Bacteroidales bacterium]
MTNNAVLKEITPLSDKDCLYIVERHKSEFIFPLHSHREYELNFIENGKGVRRVVGDSVEEIGPYELTLVAGNELEHAWEQGSCVEGDVREVTIQFSPDIFPPDLLNKSQFSSISKMLSKAGHGLNFSVHSIMRVYSLLDTLSSVTEPFDQYLNFLKILYELSQDPGARILASSSFARASRDKESRRVMKVKQYVNDHYSEDLRLETLASLAGMTPPAFSRFFKSRTGRTLSDYIIDIRLGNAARLLVDTTQNVSEICYSCGFNNLSNFNRMFKAKRGYTPRDFRALFKKKRVFV